MSLIGWFEDQYHIYIAMEYVEHGDLEMYLAGNAAKARAEVREITRQILKGVTVLHNKQICHRDLKPMVCLAYRGLYRFALIIDAEHPHRLSRPDTDQNCRFWTLNTGFIEPHPRRLWDETIPGPGATAVSTDRVHAATKVRLLPQGRRCLGHRNHCLYNHDFEAPVLSAKSWRKDVENERELGDYHYQLNHPP